MTGLHHSRSMLDQTASELPVRITSSFPARGIAADILSNSQNTKGRSLYLYGSFKEHSIPVRTRTKIRNEEDTTFSLPQTLTERTFKTIKTPRFYTVDTTSLQQQSSKVDRALDQLIANSDVTGLKEIYYKICKGSLSTLQTLISKKKISQEFVFVQNSSPLSRYLSRKTPRCTAAQRKLSDETPVDHEQCRYSETTTPQKMNKRVLVPSPYFNRRNTEKITGFSEASSQHILYSSSFGKNSRNNTCKNRIEPTVVNLNYKPPELGKNRCLNQRFCAIKNTAMKHG